MFQRPCGAVLNSEGKIDLTVETLCNEVLKFQNDTVEIAQGGLGEVFSGGEQGTCEVRPIPFWKIYGCRRTRITWKVHNGENLPIYTEMRAVKLPTRFKSQWVNLGVFRSEKHGMILSLLGEYETGKGGILNMYQDMGSA